MSKEENAFAIQYAKLPIFFTNEERKAGDPGIA